MSEEERAIKWIESVSHNIALKSENLHYAKIIYHLVINQKQELDQYKNNWEELKKWIKNISKYSYDDNGTFGDVLDKMKELEEGK